jgi:hypothetical protein
VETIVRSMKAVNPPPSVRLYLLGKFLLLFTMFSLLPNTCHLNNLTRLGGHGWGTKSRRAGSRIGLGFEQSRIRNQGLGARKKCIFQLLKRRFSPRVPAPRGRHWLIGSINRGETAVGEHRLWKGRIMLASMSASQTQRTLTECQRGTAGPV